MRWQPARGPRYRHKACAQAGYERLDTLLGDLAVWEQAEDGRNSTGRSYAPAAAFEARESHIRRGIPAREISRRQDGGPAIHHRVY